MRYFFCYRRIVFYAVWFLMGGSVFFILFSVYIYIFVMKCYFFYYIYNTTFTYEER